MRVYFLGAGASKSFYSELPTAKELTLESLLDPSIYVGLEQSPPSAAIDVLQSFATRSGLSRDQQNQPLEEILDVFEGHRYEYLSLQLCLMERLWCQAGDGVTESVDGSSREALLTGGSGVIVGPADTTQQIALQGVVNLNRVWVLATGSQAGPPVVNDGLTVYIQP